MDTIEVFALLDFHCDCGAPGGTDTIIISPKISYVDIIKPGLQIYSICEGATTDSIIVEVPTGSTVNTTVIGGTGTLNTLVPNSVYTYTSTLTDNNVWIRFVEQGTGCAYPDTNYVLVVVSDSAKGTITKPLDTICAGQTITMDANVISGTPVKWFYTSGSFSPKDSFPNADYTPPVVYQDSIVNLSYLIEGRACPDTILNKQLLVRRSPSFTFPNITPNPICAGAPTDPLNVTINYPGDTMWWSCVNCSGSFSDTTDPNAQYLSVSADNGKTLEIIWNMASEGCDTIRDTNTVNVAGTADYGSFNTNIPDICVKDTTILISATPPSSGTYYWGKKGNGQLLDNTKTPCGSCSGQTQVYYSSTSTDAGNTIEVYFITDPAGACPVDTFVKTFVVNDSARGNTNVLVDTLCYPNVSDTLKGYFISGTNKYWRENGGGAFIYTNDSVVNYVPAPSDQGNNVTAGWIIEGGACPNDTNKVNIYVSPTPNAGTVSINNTSVCAGSATDTLVALGYTGTGYWATPNGLGTFSDPNNDTIVYISDLSDPNPVTIYWIVTSPRCKNDTVRIDINVTSPASMSGTFDLATKQRDTTCVLSDYVLNASVTYGTPHWECPKCNGIISPNINTIPATYIPSPNDPDSVIISLVIEDPAATCNPLVLSGVLYIGRSPEGVPISSNTTEICAGDTTDILQAGNVLGTGVWDCIGCNGSFIDATTNSPCGTPCKSTKVFYASSPSDAPTDTSSIQLLWIVDSLWANGIQACPPDTYKYNMPVYKPPAGSFTFNDTVCAGDTTVPLGAVALVGEGTWDCWNCNGGFTLPLTGNSKYVSIVPDSSKTLDLTWIVRNGVCKAFADTGKLFVAPPSLGDFNNPVKDPACEGDTIYLNGNIVSGYGFWVVDGGPIADNGPVDSPTSWFIPDTGNVVYTIYWNITSPKCDTLTFVRTSRVLKKPSATLSFPDTACADGDVLLSGNINDGVLDTIITTIGSITTIGNNYYLTTTLADTNKTAYITVKVSDGLNICPVQSYTDSIYLGDHPFSLAFSDTTICKGDTILLQADGAMTYSWTPNISSIITNPNSPTPLVHPNTNTVFYVLMRNDTLGCLDLDSVVVNVNPKPSVSISPKDTTICSGDTILLRASGAMYYEWSSSSWFSDTFSASTYVAPKNVSVFRVVGLDANGCSDKASALVRTVPSPTLVFDIPDMCTGDKFLVSTLQDSLCIDKYWFSAPYNVVKNLTPPYPAPPLISDKDTFTFYANSAGTYFYSVLCNSSNGCKAIYEDSVKIYLQPVADFATDPLKKPPVEVSIFDPSVQFINLSQGATSYLWNFGDNNSPMNIDTTENPVHVFSGPGNYTIALSVSNEIGCSDLKIMPNFIIVKDEEYYFPTAFTPNGDGKNDYFRPLPYRPETKIILFEIYDRWGKTIFSTTDPMGWDGNSKNGKPFAPGAYSYRCIIELPGGSRKVYTGRVTLLR